jgi:hypothetical protein
MRRALRCDGVIPAGADTPDKIREMRAWLGRPELDVLAEGETPAGDPVTAAETVEPWADAGCTWWMETRWAMPHHGPDRMREIRERITAGPPRR